MIKALFNITDKTDKQEIIDFISKTSPFTTKTPKLEQLINNFIASNMEKPIILSLNDSITDKRNRINKILFFLVWVGHRNNTQNLYSGVEYIDQKEFNSGINLSRFEYYE